MRAIIILFLFIISCSSGNSEVFNTSDNKCIPKIESKDDWIVADGGRSVPLPNGKFIHLFGDTILQNPSAFVGNSIGEAECRGNEYSITYHWRDVGGTRQAFFDPVDTDDVRMWPADGFYFNKKLYLTFANIVNVDYGLGFEYAGSTLAIVSNPLDSPNKWKVSYHELTSDTFKLRPVKGISLFDSHAYIFGSIKNNPFSTILMRTPLNDIGYLEYLSTSGYKPVTSFQNDEKIVMMFSPPGIYASLYKGKWISIHNSAYFGSDKIVVTSAPHLEGPWSEEKDVYTIEELDSDILDICYAATEHPQLRMGDTFVATYSCNSLSPIINVPENIDLFLPKTILIEHLGELINIER